MNITATVFGASGLVGKELIQQLITDKRYSKVIAVVRHSSSFALPQHDKLTVKSIDFNNLTNQPDLFTSQHVFCCLGTTIKKAGSKAAMVAIDKTLPLTIAELCNQHRVERFAIVSSIGANPNSMSFYLKTKGQLESELIALKLAQLLIIRPSLLTGERKEFRLGESIANYLSPLFLLVPGAKKYAPVAGETVAQQLITSINQQTSAVQIVELSGRSMSAVNS